MYPICLIVPCYNEAGRFPEQVFRQFFAGSPLVACCLVDDGSTDGTWPMLQQLSDSFPQVSALRLENNMGKGEAIRHGVLANSHSPALQWIGYLDADAATPPQEITYMLENAKPSTKLLMGCRLQRLGAHISRSKRRHYAGRVFSTFASIALGMPVYDTQCGAKLFANDLANELFQQPFANSWLFDIELLFRYKQRYGKAHLMDSVQEIPLRVWTEKGGSHLRLSAIAGFPIALWRLWFKYGREKGKSTA